MRYILTFIFGVIISGVAQSQIQGTYIVQGQVKYTNGSPAVNWPVSIWTDTLNTTTCQVYHVKYTNPNGFYSDTIRCNSIVKTIFVSTKDCNNNYITHIDTIAPVVPPYYLITDNFIICTPGTISCRASFTASTSGNTAFFNSTASTGNSASGIVERKWSFGDGTSLTGNVINPSHIYNAPGTYLVKLVIVTSNNQCRDSVTQAVTIQQTPPGCQAYFIDSVLGNKLYANSSVSTVGFGDSIYLRRWSFGDNTGITTGNVVAPMHTYTANGAYNVCLTINSALGCVDSFCKTVVINNTTPTCKAIFTSSPQSSNTYTFTFNSAASYTTPPDVIVRRKWQFDADTLGGNLVTVTRTFNSPGNHLIKLTIFTQNGCSSTYLDTIRIVANDTSCYANFNYSTTPASSLLTFVNTSNGGNSVITGYYWTFGDSSAPSQLANPAHQFPGPGTYNVCLKIQTASGCQSMKCQPVVIQGATICNAVINSLSSFPATVGSVVNFDSRNSTAAVPDTIYQRLWSFGDGSGLSGNVKIASHVYTSPGTYTVRLIIVSTNGCRDTAFLSITVAPVTTQCNASFSDSTLNNLAYFFSGTSFSSNDSIVERRWTFGDGTSLSGNVVNPVHQYAQNGTYTVCLRITSATGCRDSICKAVVVGNNTPTCTAYFISSMTNQNNVQFNSTNSYTSPGDSIVTRIWNFGDSTTLGGNVKIANHTYTSSGTYNVCLTIITARGCQNTICKTVTVTIQPRCTAIYKYVKQNQKAILFNSASSITEPNDSIVQRRWSFGDGTVLTGNIVSPVKTYAVAGLYNVCLRIQTAKGCISEACMAIRVGDSTINVDSTRMVEILSLYPNPVTSQFTTVVWSRLSGVTAELAVIDIYGVKKWSARKILSAGNNMYTVPTNLLLTGPYTLRVTTLYGVRSKRFYKL